MIQELKAPDKQVLSRFTKQQRVLAVCGDASHGLWVVRSLGMNGLCVLAVCNTPRGRARYCRYAAGVWAQGTSPYKPEFLDEIETLARTYNVGSIMTISEANHLALIENRDRFEPGIHVFSPPDDAFAKIIDKDYMRSLCERLGVPVAKGMILADFLKSPGIAMRYPRIMRTRSKHGQNADRNAPWKVAYAENETEFNALVNEVSSIADNVLVEEFFCGTSYSINVLMHKGEPFAYGAYIGEHHHPIAGGVKVQLLTCKPGAPAEHAFRLLKELKYEGNAGVSFMYNLSTNECIFTEINPRFGGAMPTIAIAGFDLAYLLWQSHFEPDNMKKPKYRLGVRVRNMKGCLSELKQILAKVPLEPGRKRPGPLIAIGSFLWHFGPWTHDDTFLWRDPQPYLSDIWAMVKPYIPWAGKESR